MKKGFTLIELLVVICIAGILAAIFIPHVAPFLFSQKTFKLANGEIVRCRVELQNECGINLSACSTGNAYKCQHNVARVVEK